MIHARALWRILVLPVYLLIAGGIFAMALYNTSGSILSSLAFLAPWVMAGACVLAVVSVTGGLLRWRRRLNAVRHGRAARGRAVEQGPEPVQWDDEAPHHARQG